MTTKEVTVTKYIACDNQEFITRSECEAHEREVKYLVERELYDLRCERQKLRFAINEARIKARIAWLDAQKLAVKEVRSAMGKCRYFALMSNYWSRISEYNVKRREIFEVRRKIGIATDRLYMWFGLHKKSSIAKLERRRRSDAWRKANTPDKWRTPNKIRVSKLPHPARGED